MSKALPAVRSWPSLPDLELIASQTRLIIRKTRKFTAAAFLMAVLCDLRQQRYRTIATAFGSRAIQHVLIRDASGQIMPKSNADALPAHGNHYGKTAGGKIDFAFDLLTVSIVSQSLQGATEPDKSIDKEFVIEVRRSDLILRDMGYISLNEFTEIEQQQA